MESDICANASLEKFEIPAIARQASLAKKMTFMQVKSSKLGEFSKFGEFSNFSKMSFK
jgi:hypothetical protein